MLQEPVEPNGRVEYFLFVLLVLRQKLALIHLDFGYVYYAVLVCLDHVEFVHYVESLFLLDDCKILGGATYGRLSGIGIRFIEDQLLQGNVLAFRK